MFFIDISFFNFSAHQLTDFVRASIFQLDRQELKSAVAAKNLRIATLEADIVDKDEKINILSKSLGRRRASEEFHQSNGESITIKPSVGFQSNGSPFPKRQATNNDTNGPANGASFLSREVSSCVTLSSPAAITPSSTRASRFESLKQRYLKKVQSPNISEEDMPMPQVHKYNLRRTNNRG
jgi:hypothetical protein